MAYVSELFDTLRDLTGDSDDTQTPFATKKLYLNRGIARLWPAVWRVQTATLTIAADQYDYVLPVAVADGHILSVELEQADGSYQRFAYWDTYTGDEDAEGVLSLSISPNLSDLLGYDLRVRYAAPVPFITSASYAAAEAEDWLGPDRAMGIPCHYAMALISARKVDDRQDTLRYSTTQASNGVTDQDLLATSSMWMGQFELELASFDRPLPPARD